MANIKSAKKRHRQSLIRRTRNRALRTRLRAAVKNVLSSASEKGEKPEETLQQAQSILDRAANKGIIHRNKASRSAARLARRLHKAATASS